MPILDRIAQAEAFFRPATTCEFFALALARKLGAAHDLRSYLDLVNRHSNEAITKAFQTAMEADDGTPRADRFHQALRQLTQSEEQ